MCECGNKEAASFPGPWQLDTQGIAMADGKPACRRELLAPLREVKEAGVGAPKGA